jgi:hypothetical protein
VHSASLRRVATAARYPSRPRGTTDSLHFLKR